MLASVLRDYHSNYHLAARRIRMFLTPPKAKVCDYVQLPLISDMCNGSTLALLGFTRDAWEMKGLISRGAELSVPLPLPLLSEGIKTRSRLRAQANSLI